MPASEPDYLATDGVQRQPVGSHVHDEAGRVRDIAGDGSGYRETRTVHGMSGRILTFASRPRYEPLTATVWRAIGGRRS